MLAWLGLKAVALSWLLTAQAFKICKPGQSCQWWLALAWLWPEPRPMGVKCTIKLNWPYHINWVSTSREQLMKHVPTYMKKRMQTKPCGEYTYLSVNGNVCGQHLFHMGNCMAGHHCTCIWLWTYRLWLSTIQWRGLTGTSTGSCHIHTVHLLYIYEHIIQLLHH